MVAHLLRYSIQKKDSSVKSVSEKIIGSHALSGSVDTIIAIDKVSDFDTEFNLDVTSRLFESKNQRCIR